MAELVATGVPSLSTKLPPDTARLGPYVANADLGAGCPCYIMSTGKVALSTAAGANAAAEVHGWTVEAVKAGQPVSLYRGVSINYTTGQTTGSYLYLSATVAGGLQTVAQTNQTKPIALVLPPDGSGAQRIRVGGTW